MRKELIIATKNKKKFKEIKEILAGMHLRVSSLSDYSGLPEIIENGRTFKANAVKKAQNISRFCAGLVLGEDSGLCVDALGGRPGIYSSRFSGDDKNDRKNNLKLLKLLEGLPLKKRKAHYTCAVALADKGSLIGAVEGKCRGIIGFKARGRRGFGYDPLFIIPGYKKTFAQLGERIKHRMSHRFRALTKARKMISAYYKRQK
jgi:XTP/dITP diphosphohydrolase